MSDPFGDYNSGISFDSRNPAPPPRQPPRVPKSAQSKTPVPDEKRARSQSSPIEPVSVEKPRKPHPIIQPPAPILFSGILEKRIGMALLPSYHPRFFILTPHEIWYYESEDDFEHMAPPRRKIPIEKSSYVMDEGESGNKLSIVSHGKTVVVRGESVENIQEWKKKILEVLQDAKSATSFQSSTIR